MGIEMSTDIDLFDIENYRFDGNTYEPPLVNARINRRYEPPPIKTRKPQRYEPGMSFIAAMPCNWIAEAAKFNGHALHVALTIRYVYGMNPGKEVVLTRFHFDKFSTSRGEAQRGVEALQKAGLIEYTKDGHKYIITVIPTES
jgi:hypothetical protein